MAEQQAFDPTQHLILLKGKQYLEVRYRIQWFRSDYPEGRIETEIHSYSEREAVIKASVTAMRDGVVMGFASDYGSETPQDFGDFLEKASTKAIGRALGALGYGTQFCDDHEFGADQGKVVDSPVYRPTPVNRQEQQYPQQVRPTVTSNTDEATERQVALIQSIARDQKITSQALAAKLEADFGADIYTLTKKQASSIIEELKAQPRTQTQGQTSGYANSGEPAPATQPQKNRIHMLWINAGLPTEEGSKHAAFREAMGYEWEAMTKKDASAFMDMIEAGQIPPF